MAALCGTCEKYRDGLLKVAAALPRGVFVEFAQST